MLLAALADAGRPVLLVLDNVSEAAQVIPVLPRGGGHQVLVTSRDSLAALPTARLLDLPVLAPAAAVELFEAGLLARAPGDRRVRRDLDGAARVAELCGYLPLAVSIVAALLAEEPDRPISELAGELADETTRLQTLHYNARWAVRAAFDLSYQRLDAPTAALFAALSAIPGPDLGLDAAAAAAAEPASEVRGGLRALTRAHLLEARSGAQPRRMHDLIRLYAAEQLPAPGRQQVFGRVLVWYRTTTNLAERRFQALPTDPVPADFDTPAEALEWVTQERPRAGRHRRQRGDQPPG